MSHSDVQTERAVIGAVLCGATRAQVIDVRTDWFSTEQHRHIWDGIESLFAQGAAVDHLTLSDVLKGRGRLVEAGGPAYLMKLDASEDHQRSFWTEASLRQHVAILADRAARRRVHDAAERLKASTYDLNVKPERIASEGAQALLSSAVGTTFETGDVDAYEQMERWQAYHDGKPPPYLEMPHKAFEDSFKGVESSLNVFAGRSGNFKTGLLADCAWYWTFRRAEWKKGCLFGFEDGTQWLIDRMVARLLDMKYEDIGCVRLTAWQEQKYQEFMGWCIPLMRERLLVHRGPGLFAKDLLARVNRAIDVDGAQYVAIDHGLKVKYVQPGDRERYDQAIGDTMNALADKGRISNVPIIVLWHLNRGSEEEEIPKREDLKESGYLDAAARRILISWKKQGRRLVTVVKCNKGREGVTVELPGDNGGKYGLLSLNEGGEVDFAAEAQAAKEAAAAEKAARTSGKAKLFG